MRLVQAIRLSVTVMLDRTTIIDRRPETRVSDKSAVRLPTARSERDSGEHVIDAKCD